MLSQLIFDNDHDTTAVVVIQKAYFICTGLPVALSTNQRRQVPTMTTFSHAAATALDVTNSHLGKDLFGYGVILLLAVEKNGPNVPPIVSQLITKMLLDCVQCTR
jgi:hypothetical protein